MDRTLRRRGAFSFVAIIVLVVLVVGFVNTSMGPGANSSTSFRVSAPSDPHGGPMLNLTRFVDPFIGTGVNNQFGIAGGGNTFPGAVYPMGMVQWSPDTISNPPGGYFYNDTTIKGLSLTHFSGRGCQIYEDFPFMPFVGGVSSSPATNGSLYYSSFSHSEEVARPGYYRVHLRGPNVTVGVSATPRTGVGRFVYPSSSESTMLINAGGSINGNTNSGVSVDPAQNEVSGYDQSSVGCTTVPYVLYFAAKFDRSFSGYGTWEERTVNPGSASSSGQHTGAFVVFDTTTDRVVNVQVGVSFVSVANAQQNLESEFASYDLESVSSATNAAWNDRLNSIQVKGGTSNETVTFYTALYHVFIHPNVFSDDNGQYLGFDGKVHQTANGRIQYENIGSWDNYRTHIQLLSVIAPATVGDIVQSLVNDAEQSGAIPRWEQANVDSRGMSGDPGDPVIAEAYAFGARNFDASAALQWMVAGQPQSREGYADYIKLGYVPADLSPNLPSASITLEYSASDFAIARFAKALGNSTVYSEFLQRSDNWRNVFNHTSGFVQPRYANGSWVGSFSPDSQSYFHEGDSAQYTWMVTQNLGGLFSLMGGGSAAVVRLDNVTSKLNDGPSSSYLWMGNEPSIEVPWEYDFAQSPFKTQALVRQIETQYWTTEPWGLLGNDDGGEMSSWYIFATMGLYPEITGVAGFVVGSPLFTSMTVNMPGGKTMEVDAPQASDSQPYVQDLRVDGAQATSLWIPWSSLERGATVEFALGPSPSGWGSSLADSPPSYPGHS